MLARRDDRRDGELRVTFAPCRPTTAYLAEMMESVEDIPATAILSGLPWDLADLRRVPRQCRSDAQRRERRRDGRTLRGRYYVMGERSLGEEPATEDDIAAMCELVDEAMVGGALGFSTPRTFLHRVPDGRPVPGTYAGPEELLAIGDVLGRHRTVCSRPRRDSVRATTTRCATRRPSCGG